MTRSDLAFYCVSDSRYFLGAVGMVNSLRLQGHDAPLYVGDSGLEPWQRQLLATHATLVSAPAGTPPWLAKTVAPLAHPADVMVLIDADMLVTRPLDDLIAAARAGAIVAFENNVDRFVPEWGELLGLGPLTRHPYLCSGFIATGGERGAELFSLMAAKQDTVDFSRTYWRANEPGYPFLYADQDVFNAVLGATFAPEAIDARDYRLASPMPFGGLEVVDLEAMRCAYPDGTEPYVVHHILPAKPWLSPSYHGVFSQLLTRALTGPDLAISVPPRRLPLRLRQGRLADLERGRINARDRLGWFAREHLPRTLIDRIDSRRAGDGEAA